MDDRDIRVGDDEREAAKHALRQHGLAGRLTPDEVGYRVVRADNARTRGDLADLFSDLPTAPALPGPAGDADVVARPTGAVARPSSRGLSLAGKITAAMPFIALALFFLLPRLGMKSGLNWLVFLLVPLAGIFLTFDDDDDRD